MIYKFHSYLMKFSQILVLKFTGGSKKDGDNGDFDWDGKQDPKMFASPLGP